MEANGLWCEKVRGSENDISLRRTGSRGVLRLSPATNDQEREGVSGLDVEP